MEGNNLISIASGWPNWYSICHILIGSVVMFLILRAGRIQYLRGKVQKPLPKPVIQNLTKIISPKNIDPSQKKFVAEMKEGLIYSGITSAEYLWLLSSIDKNVIAAADFSSQENITSPLLFAAHLNKSLSGFDAASQTGFLNRLQGYVGEQHAYDILINQGHKIELAETANQPIWDMLVDGHQVNIKTVKQISEIASDANAHPSVTYYVNADASGEAHNNVVRLDGLSINDIHRDVHHAVDVADASAGGGMAIPFVSIALNIHRQMNQVKAGKDIGHATFHGLTDLFLNAGGAKVGAAAGGAIGLLGGPVGSLIGAAAGAIGGFFVGKIVSTNIKLIPLESAQSELQSALHQVGQYISAPLQKELHHYQEKQRHVLSLIRGEYKRASQGLWAKLWPSFNVILLEQAYRGGFVAQAVNENLLAPINDTIDAAIKNGDHWRVGLLAASHPVLLEKYIIPNTSLRLCSESLTNVEHQRHQLEVSGLLPDRNKIKDALSRFSPIPAISNYVERPAMPGGGSASIFLSAVSIIIFSIIWLGVYVRTPENVEQWRMGVIVLLPSIYFLIRIFTHSKYKETTDSEVFRFVVIFFLWIFYVWNYASDNKNRSLRWEWAAAVALLVFVFIGHGYKAKPNDAQALDAIVEMSSVPAESYAIGFPDINQNEANASIEGTDGADEGVGEEKLITDAQGAMNHVIAVEEVAHSVPPFISQSTEEAVKVDGGSLFENEMLRGDKVKAYGAEIITLLDGLIESGFEYKYGSPQAIKIKGKSDSYNIYVPDFEIRLKDAWLRNVSRRRERLADEGVYKEAIEIVKNDEGRKKYDYTTDDYDGLLSSFIFIFEIQDASGNVLARAEQRTSYIDLSYGNFITIPYQFTTIESIAGLFERNSSFRYPDIPDSKKIFGEAKGNRDTEYDHDKVLIGPIASEDIKNVSKVFVRAVKVKDYGGGLPLYRADPRAEI